MDSCQRLAKRMALDLMILSALFYVTSRSMKTLIYDDVDITKDTRDNSSPEYNEMTSTLLFEAGSVPVAKSRAFLTPSADFLKYLVELEVGQPRDRLMVAVDTEGTDLILFGESYCAQNSVSPPCFQEKSIYFFDDGRFTLRFCLDHEFRCFTSRDALNGTDIVSLPRSPTALTNYIPNSSFHQIPIGIVSSRLQPHPPYVNPYVLPPLHNLSVMSGFWGIGPLGSPTETLTSLAGSNSSVIGFDLNLPFQLSGKQSEMHFGGVSALYRDKIRWSKELGNGSFNVYDVQICNQKRYPEGKATKAIVSTASGCLTLPKPLFDFVIAWSNVKCRNLVSHFPCFLPKNIWPSLPVISFRMTPTGPLLHLELENLLMEPMVKAQDDTWQNLTYLNNDRRISHRRGLCMFSGAISSPIVFGLRSLRNLYVAVNSQDPTAPAIGMAYKPSNDPPKNLQCKAAIPCKGMQDRSADNTCKDPKCSEYFFLDLNEDTKTCELTATFHTLAAFFIILFLVVEITLNLAYEELSKRVRGALTIIEADPDVANVDPDSRIEIKEGSQQFSTEMQEMNTGMSPATNIHNEINRANLANSN